MIARKGLKINAIKLRPHDPFTWASGFRMPIYNDNRMFLFHPEGRELITRGFRTLLETERISYEVIAGTSTAGISPATTLADSLGVPMIYVRDKPKDHGLRNQIEGIDAESDLQERMVVLVEDLISTGGSSVRAVQGIRSANGNCKNCISIFNYGLDASDRIFRGKDPYDKEGHKLMYPCKVSSLLTYDTLLSVAKNMGYISKHQLEMLDKWREDPFRWGEKHGFPRVER